VLERKDQHRPRQRRPSRSQAEQAAAAALSEDETARFVPMLNRVIDALQQAKDQP
jgi:hypothetical protein